MDLFYDFSRNFADSIDISCIIFYNIMYKYIAAAGTSAAKGVE